jgi:hypothetical protein
MKIDILAYRLHNQCLSQTIFSEPVQVVSWFGAVQAQDYAGAKWALGQRLPNTTETQIDKAYDEGKILRTHIMRPTWHFVAAEDIRWLLKLTAARVHAAMGSVHRSLGIDSTLIHRSQTVVENTLRGGQFLTREELSLALKQAGISSDNQLKITYLIGSGEVDGLLCSGPRRGKQFTYALLEERVPSTRRRDHDEALAELTRRYFTSHGPATLQDFVWWSGLTVADAKSGLEMIGTELASERIDDQTYWFKDIGEIKKERSPAVHFLPDYDEYGIGYTDRALVYDNSNDKFLDARGAFLAQYTLMIDGQIMGTWKPTLKKNSVTMEVVPFRALHKGEIKAMVAAGEKYGKFLGLPVLFVNKEYSNEQRKSRSF